ncbi:hypothetical protein [Anaerotignum sp. MB30-C6]|uniref:hypothetical protein n=1 Tax=Anaerotignum sp. MB30-C6 TaxID=3070814 RepID=UPI0027DB5B86|nr:hypothetical protein [Anaerotignum sp. MB30-C6]WMI82103.1 hypothetical protein RBQ60_05040 [Anaerotignum sp. MB30-C6]
MSWAECSWILSNQASAGSGVFDRTAFEFQTELDLFTGGIDQICVCKFIAPEDGLYRYTYDVANGSGVNFAHSLSYLCLNLFTFMPDSTSIWYYGQNQSEFRKYVGLVIGEKASGISISQVYNVALINALSIYSEETLIATQQKTFEWFLRAKKGDILAFVIKSANISGVILKNQKVIY